MKQLRIYDERSKKSALASAASANLPITAGLNSLQKLVMRGYQYAISKKQMIQSSDNRYRPLVNLIVKGYVKRYIIGNDGSISVQAIYKPGTIFPITLIYQSVFDKNIYDSPEIVFYQALTDVEIYSIDVRTVVNAAEEDPSLYKDLLLEAGTRANMQSVENISLKGAYRRTAHELLYCAHQFGEKIGKSTRIKVPLTHQDIADALNLTRETVSINMHKLQQKKIIKNGQFIDILDEGRLAESAYGI